MGRLITAYKHLETTLKYDILRKIDALIDSIYDTDEYDLYNALSNLKNQYIQTAIAIIDHPDEFRITREGLYCICITIPSTQEELRKLIDEGSNLCYFSISRFEFESEQSSAYEQVMRQASGDLINNELFNSDETLDALSKYSLAPGLKMLDSVESINEYYINKINKLYDIMNKFPFARADVNSMIKIQTAIGNFQTKLRAEFQRFRKGTHNFVNEPTRVFYVVYDWKVEDLIATANNNRDDEVEVITKLLKNTAMLNTGRLSQENIKEIHKMFKKLKLI